MKISMERAWDRALTLLKGNKDVLAILAGLFFFLPSFAVVFFMPQPPAIAQNMAPQDQNAGMAAFVRMLPLFESYFVSLLPYLAVISLVVSVGRLAMLVLFTDRARPTVGEALKRALIGLVPYIAATLIVGMVLALLAMLLVVAPAKIGASAVAVFTGPLLFALVVYASIKISLVPAVIVAENTNNPLTAIRRSWLLTKGNSWRLLLFYALLLVPYWIVDYLAQGLFGMIGALAGGQQGQLFVGNAASALIAAVWEALGVAITAALYEQLSGNQKAAATPFE